MNDIYNPDHQTEFEPSGRRVRTLFNGQVVADSKSMMLLRETGRIPQYYFPAKDVRMEFLRQSERSGDDPKGSAVYWHVRVDQRSAEDAAFTFRDPPAGYPALADHISIAWDQMDAWYEEDDEIFVHARDPYKRVDVLNSSRHIKVEIDGVTVAETRRPRLLFETGMPTRYYIPLDDIRRELLVPSETTTSCPYKGDAHYYSVKIGENHHQDIVWGYRFPITACAKVEGLLCFFNEKVDIYEEGELQERPKTPWS